MVPEGVRLRWIRVPSGSERGPRCGAALCAAYDTGTPRAAHTTPIIIRLTVGVPHIPNMPALYTSNMPTPSAWTYHACNRVLGHATNGLTVKQKLVLAECAADAAPQVVG